MLQKPPKSQQRVVNRYFKSNPQNIKIGILSKLLHRIQPNFAQQYRPSNKPFIHDKAPKQIHC